MKKLIMSITAVYLLCMCCLANSASAETSQNNDIQLLIDLGIIGEELEPEFNNPMPRIDFIGLFSSIENTKNASTGAEFSFNDVDFSADYGDAFAWLCINGAIADSEYFYPYDNITLEQAAKIMVSALGYSKEAMIEGGYPNGYMNIAARLDLLDGVGSGEFTVLDACKLFRNALDVEVAAIRVDPYETSGAEKPMLERFYNVRYEKGIMTKNTQTKLNPELSDSDMTIAVGENEYVCTQKYDHLIGQDVAVYYKTDAANENNVVGVYASDKNSIAAFRSEQDTSYTDFVYTVYEGTRYEKYKIDRSVDVIYNGRIYTGYTEEDLLPENGDVSLVDNNDDGKYEVVIINSYDVYITGSGTGDGVIYDQLGKSFIDLNEPCDFTIYENGEKTDFSQITIDTLLEVRISKGEAYKLIQIDIYRNSVSGALESIKDSGRFLTVNSTEYEVSQSLRKLMDSDSEYVDEIEVGNIVCLYLDRNGYVAYITSEDSEKVFYTYLRKVLVDAPQGEDKVFFRLMLPDGSWTTTEAAERVTIDGIKKKSNELVKFVNDGNLKAPLVVKCKLDKEGKVLELETLKKHEMELTRLTYKRGSRCFDGLLSISNDCTVMVIPGAGFEADETMYEIRNAGYFTDGTNYTFDAYEVNEALVAKLIVIKGNGKDTDIANTEPLMVVDDVYETIIDDEVCTAIKTTTPTGSYEGAVKDSSIEFVDRITGKYLPFSQLNEGDLIRVLCDSKGKIINGERLVDIDKFKENKLTGAYTMSGGYRDGLLLRGGFVYAKYEDIIAITNSAAISPDSPEAPDNLVVYSAQSPSILLYDIEEETVRTASINDIIAYKDFNDKDLASFVYVQSTLGDPKYMVIYK